MKKIILLIMAFLLVGIFPLSASAAGISIQWVNITSATNSLNINTSGYCSMAANISAASIVDHCTISSYLQKYINGVWTNVDNWSVSTYNNYCSWSAGEYVTSGTYRLRSYFYAYFGGNCESASRTSASDTY